MAGNVGEISALGPFGNLVTIELLDNPGGADLTITITGTSIVLSIGTTGGVPNLDWNDLAALINADAGASALISVTGSGTFGQDSPALGSVNVLTGGAYGLGPGQYYTFAGTPPRLFKRARYWKAMRGRS